MHYENVRSGNVSEYGNGRMSVLSGNVYDLFDGDDIVGGDLVLLAARVNDCVHVYLPFMHQLVQQPNIVAGENSPVNEYVEQIHKFAQVWG